MSLLQNKAFDFLRNMPRYFWLLLVIFTITAGVLFLDHFRTYASEVTILVVHKNEKTAASADQVVINISELPKTLAFYDRLLKQFPEVSDPWIGMGDDDRKSLWQSHIVVKRINGSGLIRLQVNADTAMNASLLAQKSSANLFAIIGQYYDIRTEIDIRTVEPPVASVFIARPLGWFLASVSAGFIASALVSSLILILSQSNGRIRTVFVAKKEDKKSALLPVTFEVTSQVYEPLHREFAYKIPTPTHVPSSGAVSNLPFLKDGMSLEEHLFGNQNETASDSTEDEERNAIALPEVKEIIAIEPTPEELKRRLNQLLKGDM